MKVLIVGAVAGGASTAARLRRLDEEAEIVLFEKGDYISYANCGLPYYIGNIIKERNQLFVQNATDFKKRFNIDVRINSEVTSIDPVKKHVGVKNLLTGEEYVENYDRLVLSPGAEPVRPPLPGIDLPGIYTVRNVNDTDRIKAYVEMNETAKAVVIGAGFIGLEMAENLHHLGVDVTVIEMGDQVLAPLDFPVAAMVQEHIRSKGVTLKLKTGVTGFDLQNGRLLVNTNDSNSIEADLVILSIGVRPDTRLATAAGLQTGPGKAIFVNEFLQTSNPNIYAVGDAIEFNNPLLNVSMSTFLAGPANKQGRICAENIVHNNNRKYKGSINTAIVKVFDLTVGSAGVSSKMLTKNNVSHRISTTHSGSHAGYYPGSKQLTIQLAFSELDGQILGAQVVGSKGVDKRLDVLSAAIQQKQSVYDLAEFEHAYAPPFSSAKDPINMAGFVAENILTKRLETFYWNEVNSLPKDAVLIDVRNEDEYLESHIPGAVNIPVDEIRAAIKTLDKKQPIYLYCQVGIRGYNAYRIFKQKGFKEVYSLSGGLTLYNSCMGETDSIERASTSNLLLK
ncbi:MAG: FAD-dependent oxidoreductase [Flavitalea sp.]